MKKGWLTKTLGETCEMYQPKTISGKEMAADGAYPVFGANGVIGRYNQFNHEEPQLLITCRGATCGSVNISAPRSWVTGNAMVVRPKNASLDMRYLEYLFRGGIDISKAITGAAQPQITRTNLEPLEISYPESLAEQRRIVGLLDEAFEGIATAKANAEKNLQNARALFESHLQSVFTQKGKGWVETTLGEEIDLLAGFAFKSAQYTSKEKDIRLLRGDNIIQGCFRWDDVKRWPANDTGDYERYQLEEGDVVLAMDRPWVKAGLKHATISADDLPCLLVQRTARLRGGANLDNRFLKLLIGSSAFTSHILGVQTGIGVPHISGQQIKDFEFARPPIADQRRIADNLESLSEETRRLARVYEQKLAALEALKKSLLHRAFAGEL
ncbi:MAG: restriction endonuclease subunit S [Kiritimatiellales bacterium]